ncbi:MAG: hypothetical protein ACOX88_02640 [Christensenellales bacterium]|jgi:hypothetical protein
MKKTALTILFILLCAALGGCMHLDIACGVGDDGGEATAYLRYDVSIDLPGIDAEYRPAVRAGAHDIIGRYQGLGFAVLEGTDMNEGDGPLRIRLEKSEQAQSYPEAYEKLRQMLQDPEITPFTRVDMQFLDAGAQQAYAFEAVLEIDEIVRTANLEELPPSLGGIIRSGIEASTGEVSVTLPASEVAEGGKMRGDVPAAGASAPISYEGETKIALKTRVLVQDGAPFRGIVGQIAQRECFWIVLAVSLILATLTVLICAALLLRARRQRQLRQRARHPY